MIRAGIVGGTGYTGIELLRLLVQHPKVEVSAVTSRSDVGMCVHDLYPSMRGFLELEFSYPDIDALKDCDVVFFATPNGTAMRMVQVLLDRNIKVIDLSADFRLQSPAEWARWYGEPHACPDLLEEAVYGLPEYNRDAIRDARLIACPGCYPTAVQLGFLPLLEAGVIDRSCLIADVKSGVSGAGRKAQVSTLLCEAGESMKAYGVAGHRHLPEIRQGLEQMAKKSVGLTFAPHLAPMIRGIHATLYARLGSQACDIQELYKTRYANEVFVDVLPEGVHPDTRNVKGSNRCQIGVFRPQNGDMLVILSVIDNLVKGAAGQAVQNMNLIFNYDESLGLSNIALYP